MKKIYSILFLFTVGVLQAQYFNLNHALLNSLVFKNQQLQNLHADYVLKKISADTYYERINAIKEDSLKTNEDLAGYFTLKALLNIKQKRTNNAINYALRVKKPSSLSKNKTIINNYNLLLALVDIDLKLPVKAIENLKQCNYESGVLNYQIQYLIAQNYFDLDEHKTAEGFIQNALKQAEFVSKYDYIKCLSFTVLNSMHTGNDTLALKQSLKIDSVLKTLNRNASISSIQNPELQYLMDESSSLSSYVAIEEVINSNNLGLFYRKFGDYKKSREMLVQCISELENHNDKNILPVAYTNIGLTYTFLKDYREAETNFEKALKLYQQNENYQKTAELNNIIAKNSLLAGRPIQAIESANSAVEMASKQKDFLNLSASYIILSEIYALNADYKQSQYYFKLATDAKNEYNVSRSQQLKQKSNQDAQVNELYFNTEKEIGNSERKELELITMKLEAKQNEQTLLLIRKENELKEKTIKTQELEREQALRSLELLQRELEKQKYEEQLNRLNKERKLKVLETEKDRNRIKLLSSQKIIYEKEKELRQAETKSNLKIRGYLIFGLILISLFLAIVTLGLFRLNKQKKEIEQNNYELNIIRTNLETSHGQLEESLEEIGKQKQIIENNNTLLIDSISYSSKIQKSLMLGESQVKDYFLNSFVINLPRDIVGGDFYLVTKKANKTYVAMVDCTGHGVPGSLISIVGYQEINHILNTQYLSPAGVLKLLDININRLVNSDTATFLTDGMDVMLLEIDESSGTITFAGARSFLQIYSNGELTEYRGDRVSIGESGTKGFDFKESRIAITENDTIYLYTDGMQDQLREETKKRLGSKLLKEQIALNANKPFAEQKEAILQLFNRIKGKNKQTDDVTMLAFKPKLNLNRELNFAENPKIKEILHKYSIAQNLDGNLLLMYGEINQNTIFSMLNLLETKLKNAGFRVGIITKVKIIGVEMMQNVSKHQEMNNKVLPYFSVNGIRNSINLITGNLLDEAARDYIDESLQKYSNCSAEELSAIYKECMRKENPMINGNAGLGLIIIAMKSNGNFKYNFIELSKGLYHFHLEVCLENIA